MEPKVSIIMGSTSDMPVMEGAAKILNDFKIPFEIYALSAHRTPEEVEKFARNAAARGIKVIIAGAGMAAHLPGVIASMTTLPVIGVPIKSSLEGLDSLLSILQMPSGVPVATVGINAAQNAGILAAQIIATSDPDIAKEITGFKESLKKKVVQSNEELKNVKYPFKTN
jgi:5-(carboxyamino)imidazole ribonucleotide mutase